MKNKFYASLFIGIGLTLTAMPSMAKPAPATKKQAANNKKTEPTSTKKTPTTVSAKQKTSHPLSDNKLDKSKSHQLADTKDNRHGKTTAHESVANKDNKHDTSKTHQLLDTKNSKHGKHEIADDSDNKHGKSRVQQLADTKNPHDKSKKSHDLADVKDGKHGKYKVQQLADAKENKHSRKKSHHVAADESYQDDEEENVASTAVYDESAQATENSANSEVAVTESTPHKTLDTHYNEASTPKSSPLFFPPLDKKSEPATLVENSSQPNDIPLAQATKKINPLISAPSTINSTFSHNERVRTPIINGSTPQMNARSEEEKTPLPPSAPREQDDDLFIQPTPNNRRIHSSITHGNANSIVTNNATNHETSGQVASTHGVVESSLISAGEQAGLSSDMIMELTEIFAWDIDFANNLQAGDQFSVIYDQAGTGKAHNQIVAAQFINRGKTYTAIRYKDKEGIVSYYTPEGRSLRKAFLSTPVDFARVSSPFSTHRMHPILNRIRAHKGVDYAARTGTPVKSAGDGVVTFHGNKGAYGRMIVISHGEHYETAYAHLSNFRKDLQDGQPVKQGELIGYVGQSGLATGPHLHYEFRVDGEHRDPEKLDGSQGMRLAGDDWNNFHAQTSPVLKQLYQAKANSLLAKNP